MNDTHQPSPAPAPEPTPPPQTPTPAASAVPPAPPAPQAGPLPSAPAPDRPLFRRLPRPVATVVGTLALLAAAFYAEEDWRGAGAWDAARNKLEVQQEKLDWAAYIPPAVSDDQNFFKAPKMQDWFAGTGTNELTARLSLSSFAELAWHRVNSNASVVVTELFLRPPGANDPPPEICASLHVDNVPLSEAIRSLAGAAHLTVDLDPLLLSGRPGPDGKPAPPARVTGQWTNVSALSVLMALMCDNDLRWVEDPKTGVPLIKYAGVPASGASNALNLEFVLATIRDAIGPVGMVADGFPISGNALRVLPPRRLSIAPDSVPTLTELARIFPGARMLRVEPGGNSLRVFFNLVPVAAADYLSWSGQFSPEFDLIRQAVKRPAARLDGDYHKPYRLPALNLMAVDAAASRLASRAGAFLMLDRPADALPELTLLRDLRGCMEAKPTGKPMALSTAMTDVAISGIYADTISYGLQLHVWRDSELAALQDQLSQMDVVAPVWSALESERAGSCCLLETGDRSDVAQVLNSDTPKASLLKKITSPARLTLKLMPRGWLRQNLARLAVLDQVMIDSIARPQDFIRPRQTPAADARIAEDIRPHGRSPFWFLAKNMISRKSASLKATALAQSKINQALAVCALERCRLARGQYPATLHDLVPLFVPFLPPDPVNGGPFHYKPDAAGGFLLYSIGWDEQDDNGAPVDAAGKGDWVWGRL